MNYPFLLNKYTKWYFNIISHAKLRVNNKGDYLECHHIIPRSLDGRRTKENEVYLTAREHFICHLLLRKMTIGDDKRKMSYAAFAISHVRRNNKLKIRARIFEILRKEYGASRLGIPRSEETKRKISKSKKDVPLSQDAKDAIRRGVKQRHLDHPASEETRKKIGNAHRGKIYRDETRKKIGSASEGRIQSGAKNWILLSPIGVEHKVYCLKKFCMENNLTWKPLSNSQNGIPIVKGASKGWSVVARS